MSLDASVIAHAVKRPSTLVELQAAGISADDFVDDFQRVWRYIVRMQRQHGKVPSSEMIEHRFDWIELPEIRKRDLPMLLHEMRQRRQYTDLIRIVREGVDMLSDFDSVDEARSYIVGSLNAQNLQNGKSALRDLFSKEVSEEMIEEIRRRRNGEVIGIPTGFKRFDAVCGGLIKQRMVVIIGRPGKGKSWLDLLFVMEAVLQGYKFVLYPLEMTLVETAMRLYTMLSYRLQGEDRVLKNMDLLNGRISPKKVVKFLHFLEDHYKGQLYVADVGSLSDRYTIDRIEAEQSLHQSDGFCVDHITLLKPNESSKDSAEYTKIRELSHGIKGIAQRQDCVGIAAAHVSRDALKTNSFLPRLEHIMYGDSIGQDADQVIPINRKGKYLFYGVVKNRHGPEIGRTRVQFFPNEGMIIEDKNQDDEDENEV